MAEVHHIEHTLVALVRPQNDARDVNITIGMVGCMGLVAVTTRAGVEALRDACEAALRSPTAPPPAPKSPPAA